MTNKLIRHSTIEVKQNTFSDRSVDPKEETE
jgi:hypothetical protein